jgi:putative redox protein
MATRQPFISEPVSFFGSHGLPLAARLDRPRSQPRAYALFAHCFSCSKDVFAASRIAAGLARKGVAVLRFDFTGLGASEGDFTNTNFSSNVADLKAAAYFMAASGRPISLLIGHSLGGTAALVVARSVPSVKAVVTLCAPSSADHVLAQFANHVDRLEQDGIAEVKLGGRAFTLKRQFIEDVGAQNVAQAVEDLRLPLLVMHAPLDATVGIENAAAIYGAAKHPKSFISLDAADHLLTSRQDAAFAAETIVAWAGRYAFAAEAAVPEPAEGPHAVRVSETLRGPYEAHVVFAQTHTLAGEPQSLGGIDSGPSPFEFLAAGLAACTAMTLRMYAARKGWPVEHIAVDVTHTKSVDVDGVERDEFSRKLSITGPLEVSQLERLQEIAAKCPVHRALSTHALLPSPEIATV